MDFNQIYSLQQSIISWKQIYKIKQIHLCQKIYTINTSLVKYRLAFIYKQYSTSDTCCLINTIIQNSKINIFSYFVYLHKKVVMPELWHECSYPSPNYKKIGFSPDCVSRGFDATKIMHKNYQIFLKNVIELYLMESFQFSQYHL